MVAVIIIWIWGLWWCYELNKSTWSKSPMNLYEFMCDEGSFWVAAETEEKAIRFFAKLLDCKRKHVLNDYVIDEVPYCEWRKLKVKSDVKLIKDKTVADYMWRLRTPQLICTTFE